MLHDQQQFQQLMERAEACVVAMQQMQQEARAAIVAASSLSGIAPTQQQARNERMLERLHIRVQWMAEDLGEAVVDFKAHESARRRRRGGGEGGGGSPISPASLAHGNFVGSPYSRVASLGPFLSSAPSMPVGLVPGYSIASPPSPSAALAATQQGHFGSYDGLSTYYGGVHGKMQPRPPAAQEGPAQHFRQGTQQQQQPARQAHPQPSRPHQPAQQRTPGENQSMERRHTAEFLSEIAAAQLGQRRSGVQVERRSSLLPVRRPKTDSLESKGGEKPMESAGSPEQGQVGVDVFHGRRGTSSNQEFSAADRPGHEGMLGLPSARRHSRIIMRAQAHPERVHTPRSRERGAQDGASTNSSDSHQHDSVLDDHDNLTDESTSSRASSASGVDDLPQPRSLSLSNIPRLREGMGPQLLPLSSNQVRQLCSFVPLSLCRSARAEDGDILMSTVLNCGLFLADLSGFTELGERLAADGPDVIGILGKTLDSFLDLLCNVIVTHGGDVVKFAGGTLVACFCPASSVASDDRDDRDTNQSRSFSDSLHVIRAAQASIQMHAACVKFNSNLQNLLRVRGMSLSDLSIRAAIGLGELKFYRVRASARCSKYVVNGEPFEQVRVAQDLAQVKQTVVSSECWRELKTYFEGFPESNAGAVRLAAQYREISLPPPEEIVSTLIDPQAILPYISEAVQAAVATDCLESLGSFRPVTVVFTTLRPRVGGTLEFASAHAALKAINSSTESQGMVLEWIVDEHHCVIITVFGVAPQSGLKKSEHNGLTAAIEGVRQIGELGLELQAHAGVATGNVYCGPLGGEHRREFTVVGDTVGLSAQLSNKARPWEVLCDGTTRRECCGEIPLKAVASDLQTSRRFSYLVEKDSVNRLSKSSDGTLEALLSFAGGGESGTQLPPSLMASESDLDTDSEVTMQMCGRDEQLQAMNSLLEDVTRNFFALVSSNSLNVEDLESQLAAALLQDADDIPESLTYLATITGETGHGKSMLLSTWQRGILAAASGSALNLFPAPAGDFKGKLMLLSASCDEITVSRPYFAFGVFLRQLFRLHTAPLAEQRARVKNIVTELDSDLVPLVPLLEAVLQLGFSDSVVTNLFNAGQRVDKVVEICIRLMVKTSLRSEKLLVLVLDNIHWLDPSSQHLLSVVLKHFPIPVMVVIARQPSSDKFIDDGIRFQDTQSTAILLEAFPPKLVAEVANRLCGADECPQVFYDYILENSRGVPLLVKQLTLALRENNVFEIVVAKSGSRHLRLKTDLAKAQLPQSVKSIVIARFDRLNPSTQALMKTAVVIASGAVAFTAQVMARTAQKALSDTRSALNRLLAMGLVEETVELSTFELMSDLDFTDEDSTTNSQSELDSRAYTVPLLIQSVMYDTMLRSQRAMLHERCARVYEELGGESSDVILQLAHHWRHTPDKLRASDYTWKAVRALERLAERQVREYSNKEAWSVYDTTLGLIREIPASLERSKFEMKVLLAVVPVVVSAASWAEAGAYIDDAGKLIRSMLDEGRDATTTFEGSERPYLKMMGTLAMQTGYMKGDIKQFRRYVDDARSFISKLDDPPADLMIMLHHLNWTIMFVEGRHNDALAEVKTGLAIYLEDIEEQQQPTNYFLGHDAGLCALSHRSLLSYVAGDFATVRSTFDEIFSAVLHNPHANSCAIARSLACLAMALTARNEEDLARLSTASASTIEYSECEGLPFSQHIASMAAASAKFYLGDQDGAVAQATHTMTRAQFLPFRAPMAVIAASLLLHEGGRLDDAVTICDQTLARLDQAGFSYFQSELYRIRGESLFRQAEHSSSAGLRMRGHQDILDALRVAAESRSPVFALSAFSTAARLGVPVQEAHEQLFQDLIDELDPAELLVRQYMQHLPA